MVSPQTSDDAVTGYEWLSGFGAGTIFSWTRLKWGTVIEDDLFWSIGYFEWFDKWLNGLAGIPKVLGSKQVGRDKRQGTSNALVLALIEFSESSTQWSWYVSEANGFLPSFIASTRGISDGREGFYALLVSNDHDFIGPHFPNHFWGLNFQRPLFRWRLLFLVQFLNAWKKHHSGIFGAQGN